MCRKQKTDHTQITDTRKFKGRWVTHKDLDISLGSLAELDTQPVIPSELGYISSNEKILSQIEISR